MMASLSSSVFTLCLSTNHLLCWGHDVLGHDRHSSSPCDDNLFLPWRIPRKAKLRPLRIAHQYYGYQLKVEDMPPSQGIRDSHAGSRQQSSSCPAGDTAYEGPKKERSMWRMAWENYEERNDIGCSKSSCQQSRSRRATTSRLPQAFDRARNFCPTIIPYEAFPDLFLHPERSRERVGLESSVGLARLVTGAF